MPSVSLLKNDIDYLSDLVSRSEDQNPTIAQSIDSKLSAAGKGLNAIHQSPVFFTNDEIEFLDGLLEDEYQENMGHLAREETDQAQFTGAEHEERQWREEHEIYIDDLRYRLQK